MTLLVSLISLFLVPVDIPVSSNALLHMQFSLGVDPKVEVIYVSPVELNDEVYQYYSKLLGMKARRPDRCDSDVMETSSADHAEKEDIESRYKIIVPDAVDRFPVRLRYPIHKFIWQGQVPIQFNTLVFTLYCSIFLKQMLL